MPARCQSGQCESHPARGPSPTPAHPYSPHCPPLPCTAWHPHKTPAHSSLPELGFRVGEESQGIIHVAAALVGLAPHVAAGSKSRAPAVRTQHSAIQAAQLPVQPPGRAGCSRRTRHGHAHLARACFSVRLSLASTGSTPQFGNSVNSQDWTRLGQLTPSACPSPAWGRRPVDPSQCSNTIKCTVKHVSTAHSGGLRPCHRTPPSPSRAPPEGGTPS